jgi:hypothetical protein
MSLLTLSLINIILLTALVAIPTAIVYRRNKGTLSITKSYTRAIFHIFRVMGWMFIVVGVTFLPFIFAGMTGHLDGNWPWWSLPFILAYIGVGYGLQRFMKFLLKDEDLKNMFASKDR